MNTTSENVSLARNRKSSKVVTALKSSKVARQALVCSVFVRQTPNETCVVIMMGVRPYQGARWYDPANGRFNRLDPFFGNVDDPQSLHKYLYVHGDPIQGVDPTGLNWTIGSVLSAIHIGLSFVISYSIPVLYFSWLAAIAWTATAFVAALLEEAIYGETTELTQGAFDLGIYVMEILSFVTAFGLLYPRTPVRLADTGGLRYGAQRIHAKAGTTRNNPSTLGQDRARRSSAVSIAQAKLKNGTKEYFVSGSGAKLSPTQVAEARKLGIPEKNIFNGAQYRSTVPTQNHAEQVIDRNLPPGARVLRWGISHTEVKSLGGNSWPFPCAEFCTPVVKARGGVLELNRGDLQGLVNKIQ